METRKLSFQEMENIDGSLSAQCWTAMGGALLLGTGGIIFAAATGGVGAIAFAMAGNYFGWGMIAWTCKE